MILRGSVSGGALLVAGALATGAEPISGGNGSFTIETTATSVLPGESVGFSVQRSSETGFAAYGVTDVDRDILWEWDFDDDAAEMFVTGGGKLGNQSARTARIRAVNKAWTSTGTKAVTCTAYTFGGVVVATETINITVRDPDSDSWDYSIYWSPAGNWTGMPADNGSSIRRVQTWADYQGIESAWAVAAGLSEPGLNVRVILADGEDLSIDSSGSIGLDMGRDGRFYLYSESYGVTNRPTWTVASGQLGSGGVFGQRTGDPSPSPQGGERACGNIVLCGVDIDMGYDPIEADFTPSSFMFLNTADQIDRDHKVHLSNMQVHGFYDGVVVGGANDFFSSNIAYRFLYNVRMGRHFNYCVFHGQGMVSGWTNGCDLRGDPQTSMGDGKNTVRDPEFPDHALGLRYQNSKMVSCYNSDLAGASGWASVTSSLTQDDPMQECIRIHPLGVQDYEVYVADSRFNGKSALYIREINTGEGIDYPPAAVIIERNLCTSSRNRAVDFMFSQVSPCYVRNNIFWITEIFSQALISTEASNFYVVNDPTLSSVGFSSGPSYIEFNTCISDRDSTLSGNSTFTEINTTAFNGWSGDTINSRANWVEVPNHSNAASYPTQGTPSRADLFVPVTGSAVINGITSGYRPVDDYNGNFRSASGNTNEGAHDTSVASDAGVSAPSNTVAPTINTYSQYTTEHYIENGTWTNLDPGGHLGPIAEHLWLRDYELNDVSDAGKPTRWAESLNTFSPGDILTGRVGYVNIGGTIIWADVSNSVTL